MIKSQRSFNHIRALKSVLSQTCDIICGVEEIDRSAAFDRVHRFIQSNSRQWRMEVPVIDYHDPFCRMAYLYMNVPLHAVLVERAMTGLPRLQRLLRERAEAEEAVSICALGGGPGSELLGLVQYIEALELEKLVRIDIALVDKVQEWDESWHALKTGVEEQYRSSIGPDIRQWPVLISRSFLPLDLTRPDQLRSFPTRFASVDVFLMTYVVSELLHRLTSLTATLGGLVKRAKADALFLAVDRDQREVREAIDLIFEQLNLEKVAVVQERGEVDEFNFEDFGEWYLNIEPLPRRRWLTVNALASKRQRTA